MGIESDLHFTEMVVAGLTKDVQWLEETIAAYAGGGYDAIRVELRKGGKGAHPYDLGNKKPAWLCDPEGEITALHVRETVLAFLNRQLDFKRAKLAVAMGIAKPAAVAQGPTRH